MLTSKLLLDMFTSMRKLKVSTCSGSVPLALTACEHQFHLCVLQVEPHLSAMGYAGYAPAKLPPAKTTGLQAALWSIDNMECLEVC